MLMWETEIGLGSGSTREEARGCSPSITWSRSSKATLWRTAAASSMQVSARAETSLLRPRRHSQGRDVTSAAEPSLTWLRRH
eukprot:2543013-Rhodomonas_salina.1